MMTLTWHVNIKCLFKTTIDLHIKCWCLWVGQTYCLIQSGMDTYSIGTSSASSVRLYTYLIFWLNLELQKEAGQHYPRGTDTVFLNIIAMTSNTNLIKGFVSANRVRINQEGWTMIKDFKFFLNLDIKGRAVTTAHDDAVPGTGLCNSSKTTS